MDSSSHSSKPRKGIRKWMDRLSVSRSGSRSRSRSPSQSTHRTDPQSLPPAIELSEDTGLNTRAGFTTTLNQATQVTTQTTGPPSVSYSESTRAQSSIPTFVEPTEDRVPSDEPVAEPENESLGEDTSEPRISQVNSPKAGQKPGNAAWITLRTSLHLLRDSSSLFPPFASALGVLLSCIDGLEIVAGHRQDYEEMATTLSTMGNSMKEYTKSTTLTDSMSNLALSLEREATEIHKKLVEIESNSFRNASSNEEEVLRHCRRVQSLFQQLQTNVNFNIWRIADEQLANTRLEGLQPVKQATYDSDLSMEVSRRGCSEGTRQTVLAELHSWLNASDSASIYWMNGMAGTGKTTIAYTFCEQAETRKQLAASFFCTRNAVECRKTSRIIPSIAYQLARYSIPYKSSLCQVLEQSPDIGSKHVVKQFEQLLKDPLQKVKDAMPVDPVVVIDALDECADQNGVELILDMLFRWAGQVPLKFLVTSRPEPEIFSKMRLHEQSRAVIHLHDIETSLVRADIEKYLVEELEFMSPSQTDILELSHRAGSLFIYAATLVRYILYGKRVANPRQRLRSVLSLTSESTKKNAEIDALYTAILESALQEAGMEDQEVEDMRAVLRTVLFAQEPIDVDTIALLSGMDDSDRVLYALQPMRSVIHQSEETGVVSTLHASFHDFLLSRNRSGSFFCDAIEHSQLLAQRCFAAMSSQLRFNICALNSSFVPDDKVDGLQTRIKANITPALAYICQHWASHLGMAKKSGALIKMLSEFLSHRLLFWMEVLNLMRAIHFGMDMLQKANLWVNQIGTPVSEEQLLKLVQDSYTFITNFAGSAASQSTPHIYISCLPFCSRSSEVYKTYWNRTQGLLELKGSLIDQRDSAALASWTDSKFGSGAFSPDGSRIVGRVGDAVMIRNVYNGASLVGPMLGHTESVCACCFSSDGSRVASASQGGTIRVWDAYNGALTTGPLDYDVSHIKSLIQSKEGISVATPFNHGTNHISSIAVSPDGIHIAFCFRKSSTVYLLEALTGKLIRAVNDHTDHVHMVLMSPDGTMFASASTVVRLSKVEDGAPFARPYEGHSPNRVSCLTFTPDGTRIVSYSDAIHVWRISDGSLVAKFAPNLDICSLAVSPNGMQIASGSEHTTIIIWKTDDGTLLGGPFYASSRDINMDSSHVTALMYTLEGNRLTSRASDGTVAVWSTHGDMLPKLSSAPRYSLGLVDAVAFSDDGSHLLTSGNMLTYIPGDTRFIPHAAEGSITAWSVHPSASLSSGDLTDAGGVGSSILSRVGGHRLTPNQYRRTITQWDTHNGSFTEVPGEGPLFPDTYSKSLSSPDGLYAVTLTEGRAGRREVITVKDQAVILGPWPLTGTSYLIASQFSPDSSKIAVGLEDGLISVWDLQSREVVAGPLAGHSTAVKFIALSPDGSLVASLAHDDTLRIFDTRALVLDLIPDSNLDPAIHGRIIDGWDIRADGWVTNSSSHLLFWVPLEFKFAWPSPHTSLVITQDGTVQVPKQTLFLGEQWHKCYNAGHK